MRIAKHLIVYFYVAAHVAFGADTNYAVRLDCELQTAGPASLKDVNWTQGQTPLMELRVLRNGRPVAADTNTSVRMLFAASSTATTYAVATNYWPATNAASYYVQWGAIGTNTAGTGTTAQAWFYTVYFDKISTGETYWSGNGALYVEKSTSLADGLDWTAATNLPRVAWPNVLGDPANNAALVAYLDATAGEDAVARAGVASNAAEIAIMSTGKLDAATAATTYQPAGSYATGTPIYAETDSIALAAIATNGAVASNAYAAATNAQQVANAALPSSATNGAEWGSHAGLVKTGHVGKVVIDGMLNVQRSTWATNFGDYTFRAWNGGDAEFNVDTRENYSPNFSLESASGWTFFSHKCLKTYDELWITRDDNANDISTVHANLAADFIELTDIAAGSNYRFEMGDLNDVYGGHTYAPLVRLWSTENGTNEWHGRVNDVEANRIAALAESQGGISASTATGIAQTVATSYGYQTAAQAGQIATNVVGHGLSDYYVVAYAPSIALNPTNGYRQGLYLAGTSIVSIAGGATNQMGSVRLDAWTGTNQHLFTNPVPAGTWSTSAVNTVIYSKPSHSAAWTARVFQW